MKNMFAFKNKGTSHTIRMIALLVLTILIPFLSLTVHIEVYVISCVTTFISCSFLNRGYTTIVCFISYLCFLWSSFWKLYVQWGEQLWTQKELKVFLIEVIGLTVEFMLVYFLALSIINVAQKMIHEREVLYQEKQLVQQKIEMQSDFLAYMSHEIRTPVNAVLSINEMLLQETNEPKTENYAIKIRTSAIHLLNYVTNVLDYTKIEAGKLEIVKKEFEVTSLLKELIDVYNVQSSSKGLTFIYEIETDIPRRLIGDEMRIHQAYTNILSNAVKYTDEGTIRFCVHFQKLDAARGKLVCSVIDTGTGIRTEDMSRLFGSYSRLNLEKNQNIQGSGLGLKICKQIIDLMDGSLDVQSEFGRGSTFTVVIPLEFNDENTIGDFNQEIKRLERKGRDEVKGNVLGRIPNAKILIVDDNDINLQVAEAILKKTDCDVRCLDSGKACLEEIYKTQYDMILLDHMMPDIDGLAVLKEMKEKADHLCTNTKIVVLTANAVSGAKSQYMELGFDDYISKPISIKELDRVMKQLLPDYYKTVEEALPVVEEELSWNWNLSEYHIDTEKGLEFLDYDKEHYLAMAKIFFEDYEKRIEKLGMTMEEENLTDYAILVHGLKGNARTLGAATLGELAFEEEKAAKAGNMEFLEEHQYELGREWKLVVDGFRKLISTEDMTEESPIIPIDITMQEFEDQILMTMACVEGGQYAQAKQILEELLNSNIEDSKKILVKESLNYLENENVVEAGNWLNKVWKGE